MTNPKISVIIPVYNAEKYLKQCLDSLLCQTLDSIEIICINDGSSDNSINILKQYKEQYDNITVLDQKHSNAGVARNKGIAAAKGEYLAFLDADDYYLHDAFLKIIKRLEDDKDIDILVYRAFVYNEASKKTIPIKDSLIDFNCPPNKPFSPIEMKDYLFNSFQFWVWNKVFKRNYITANDIVFQDVSRSNDVMFVTSALIKCTKIDILNDYLIIHRIGHCTNMQANNSEEPLAFSSAYRESYSLLKKYKNSIIYERSFINAILKGTIDYLRSIKNDEEALSLVVDFMKEEGEKEFCFLSRSKDYYYEKRNYNIYKNIITNFDDKHKIPYVLFIIPKKVYGTIISLINNGFVYTINRVLFHLHLKEDNDPARTKMNSDNYKSIL